MSAACKEVSISSVQRGWLVSTRSRSGLLRLGAALRRQFPTGEVLAHRDGYVVRPSSLGQLVELFPPEDGGWDGRDAGPALAFAELQKRQERARVEVAEALEEPYAALADYPRLDLLDAHQVEAVAAMTVPSLVGLALFDEQGVGKTLTALAAYDLLFLRGVAERLLVITPKSVISAWQRDAKLLWGESKRVSAVSGERKERHEALLREHEVLLVGYESAVAEKVYLKALLGHRGSRYVLVTDESYYIKNPATRRSTAVAELRQHCQRAFVLCGSPAPNSPRDIVHQVDVADVGATFGKIVLPASDIAAHRRIRDALDSSAILLRRLKEDVLEYCPPKETERVYVDFQPTQRRLYEAALTSLVSDVLSVDEADFRRHLSTYMARRAALLQICSHPGAVAPGYAETPAKFLALDRLVDELVAGGGEKVIIWSFYRYALERLDQRFRALGLVRIDGSVASATERARAIEAFQSDPAVKIFLGNPAAAGAGITLTAAAHAIFESFSNQPAHYLQSVDRIHRRGQHRKVVSHVLVTLGSLEENEFERLLGKERAARELLRDHTKEPTTRRRFLRELGVDVDSEQDVGISGVGFSGSLTPR